MNRLQHVVTVRSLQHGSVRTKTTIDMACVHACFEDGYGTQQATKVIGAFGDLLVDVPYATFTRMWRQFMEEQANVSR